MLDTLNEVQDHDLKLDGLNSERANVPPTLIDIRARKLDLERKLERKRQEHEALRRRVSTSELELQDLMARRKGASDSALRALSAKEASQYQNQEIQFATRVQEAEDELLPLMEGLEFASEQVAQLEEQAAELAPTLDELEREERGRVEEIERRLANVGATRGALAATIEPALLRQYEQVRKARRGVGLVEIRDRSRCGGCNVQLPIHVVQKARRDVGVTRCPSCGRILWNRSNDG